MKKLAFTMLIAQCTALRADMERLVSAFTRERGEYRNSDKYVRFQTYDGETHEFGGLRYVDSYPDGKTPLMHVAVLDTDGNSWEMDRLPMDSLQDIMTAVRNAEYGSRINY